VLAAAGSGTKPAGKGVDMDAVGNVNGVPVYEFDLDTLKVEDKPWRKPGMQCFLFHVFKLFHSWSACSFLLRNALLCKARL